MAKEKRTNELDLIFLRELYPLADQLYSFAWNLTNDTDRAEDLVQETYMKAWRFIESYESGTNARAWLFKICRNAFINEYRTKKAQPYKTDFEDIVVYHNEDDPTNPRYFGLHEEMHDKLMGDEVMLAIKELPETAQTVVLLDLEDFTYEEIAAIVDIPIGTVRSRLHRARNILADKLRGYAEDRGISIANKGNVVTNEGNCVSA